MGTLHHEAARYLHGISITIRLIKLSGGRGLATDKTLVMIVFQALKKTGCQYS